MYVTEDNVRFKAVRASGPGGQRTNRRSTKVQMWVKINDLPITEKEKKLVREHLAHHVNHADELEVQEEEERSQEMNRDKALARMNQLIEEAIKVPAPRIPTQPSRNAENTRIAEKKMQGEKKRARRL